MNLACAGAFPVTGDIRTLPYAGGEFDAGATLRYKSSQPLAAWRIVASVDDSRSPSRGQPVQQRETVQFNVVQFIFSWREFRDFLI